MERLQLFLCSPYGTLSLLAVFLLGAIGLFVWQASPEAPEDLPAAVAPHAATAPASASARATAKNNSPFLTTHEQATVFTPDGENLAPSFHVEMEALRRTLDASPQDTTALLRMARLLHDGHKTAEAAAYYRRYLDVNPEGRQAWLDLARCYGELNQWDNALVATQEMLTHFPDNPSALYNLGAIYANTGRLDEARKTWQRVAAQSQDPSMKAKAKASLQQLDAMQS